MNVMNKFFLITFLLVFSLNSLAYIGPGMSGGIFAAVIGFIVAIILGLWAIIFFPIKRMLKNRKYKKMLHEEPENDS